MQPKHANWQIWMRRPTNLAMLKMIMCGKRVNAEKVTGDPCSLRNFELVPKYTWKTAAKNITRNLSKWKASSYCFFSWRCTKYTSTFEQRVNIFPVILKSCCSLVDYYCVDDLHASVSLKGITEFKMADRNFYTYMHVLCPESENAIVTVAIHRYPHSADSWWLSRDLSFSIKYLATVISCCAGNLRIVGILWSILDNN